MIDFAGSEYFRKTLDDFEKKLFGAMPVFGAARSLILKGKVL
jgi:hypothetical protein